MQHNHIGIRLLFFERLYTHLDDLDYIPGIGMLFKALPIKLQAHMLGFKDDKALPDPEIFNAL